jgi:hypothetical protein
MRVNTVCPIPDETRTHSYSGLLRTFSLIQKQVAAYCNWTKVHFYRSRNRVWLFINSASLHVCKWSINRYRTFFIVGSTPCQLVNTNVWRSLLPPHSSLCVPKRVILKMGTALSFEKSVIICQSTRCHNSRDLSLHQRCAMSPTKWYLTPWHSSMEVKTRIMATVLMQVGSGRIMDPHKKK